MSDKSTCYSGGASGADALFGQYASGVGHEVVHFSFEGHKSKVPTKILTKKQLLEADPFLEEANKWIKRTFPASTEEINNLLRRNYWQIKDTNSIYAISEIGDRGILKGGTAWAVMMGILRGVPDVFVYDQKTQVWSWCCTLIKDPEFIVEWTEIEHQPPKPSGLYTGIGARTKNLRPHGRKAIQDLYTK